MSISINATPGAGLTGVDMQDSVGMAVLKKAIDSQAGGAQQLIASLPAPAASAARRPVGSLGNHIDTQA